MNRIIITLIYAYQKWCSPFLIPSCRFHPSCSQYAVVAFGRYGFFKGLKIVIARLARCQPWSKGGWDPVK